MPYAHIIVDIPARAVDREFDYGVGAFADTALLGAPVLVTFAGRLAVGYVVGLSDTTTVEKVLDVDQVLGEPLFDEGALGIARWIAEHYLSTLMDAVRLFLPPGASHDTIAGLELLGPRPADDSHARIWDAVQAGVDERALERSMGRDARGALDALIARGVVRRAWRLRTPDVGSVDDRWVEMADPAVRDTLSPRATLQHAVLDAVTTGPVRMPELTAQLGPVHSAVSRLEELGAVKVVTTRRWRTPAVRARLDGGRKDLTADQAAALDAITHRIASGGGVIVLDGVTGSGKTEVYMQAIEQVRAAGGSAIVLVPEISLTPQTLGRFRTRFGDDVAVLHSRLGAGERFDQWSRAAAGDAGVVLGARSALFAPIHDLRLIVIDEEHESSYKQGSAPRYHARDVARRMSEAFGITLVLGSATPSMESLHDVEIGRSEHVVLPHRVVGAPPSVLAVDMTAEFEDGHRSMFSRPLVQALIDVRDAHQKAVLFLNRRGFAAFLLCRECGFVPECPQCSVSLTYHETGRRLACHHCGHGEPVPAKCPRCGSPYLRQFGAGTQRVEAELAAVVPGLPVVRMDADTTSGKGGHERRLVAFEALESGILLGTQMVAKGLDYADVTLVGVINADTTMHLPDFRASERTYQLLEQVAGRAGRGDEPGRVIIQTYWLDHPALEAVLARDRDILYAAEREERRAHQMPPFGALANIVVSGEALDDVKTAAQAIAQTMRDLMEPGIGSILGPSPSALARVKRLHRWHILVKNADSSGLAVLVRAGMAIRVPSGVSVVADIDPLDLM